jgi:hypothetical protein
MAKTKTKTTAKAKAKTQTKGKGKFTPQHVHCSVWWQGGGTVFMPFRRNKVMSGPGIRALVDVTISNPQPDGNYTAGKLTVSGTVTGGATGAYMVVTNLTTQTSQSRSAPVVGGNFSQDFTVTAGEHMATVMSAAGGCIDMETVYFEVT